MKVSWFDKNGWLVISGIFFLVLAALVFAQSGPAFFGHSSDEVEFSVSYPPSIFDDCSVPGVVSQSCDCSNSPNYLCVATCPKATSTPTITEYRAFAGNCLSLDGRQWSSTGVGASATDGFTSWECLDETHLITNTFKAQVICVEVGK